MNYSEVIFDVKKVFFKIFVRMPLFVFYYFETKIPISSEYGFRFLCMLGFIT